MFLGQFEGTIERALRHGYFCGSLLLAIIVWTYAENVQTILSSKQFAIAKEQYGPHLEVKLVGWSEVLSAGQSLNELEKLRAVNQYFNDQIRFKSDERHWNLEDYWATPLESLGTTGGDCEDFVIAKYFSLIRMGVSQSKLRLTYVKALKLNQAHMVLAYYPNERSEPWVLDNLIDSIEKASNRKDLEPVYSFNSQALWLERERGGSIKVGNPNRLNMWTDLLVRMQEQGLEALLEQP